MIFKCVMQACKNVILFVPFQSIGHLGWCFLKSICPSVSPPVCVFTFEVPFKRLFAPTFQSRMSNIFRDLESLGKRNEKKWYQIWTFFVGKWSKIIKQTKNSFFFMILLLSLFGHLRRLVFDQSSPVDPIFRIQRASHTDGQTKDRNPCA